MLVHPASSELQNVDTFLLLVQGGTDDGNNAAWRRPGSVFVIQTCRTRKLQIAAAG
jgi:hypothetical protein